MYFQKIMWGAKVGHHWPIERKANEEGVSYNSQKARDDRWGVDLLLSDFNGQLYLMITQSTSTFTQSL